MLNQTMHHRDLTLVNAQQHRHHEVCALSGGTKSSWDSRNGSRCSRWLGSSRRQTLKSSSPGLVGPWKVYCGVIQVPTVLLYVSQVNGWADRLISLEEFDLGHAQSSDMG